METTENKIHRLAYRFFNPLEITKIWPKSRDFWFADFFRYQGPPLAGQGGAVTCSGQQSTGTAVVFIYSIKIDILLEHLVK